MSLGVIPLNQNLNKKKSPVEAPRVTTTTKRIQGHSHKCRKGYADIFIRTRWPPSDKLSAAQDNSECKVLSAKLDHPSPCDQIETTRQAHPWGHSAPRQCKASYGQHNHGTLAEIQVGGSWSPSIQFRPLPLRLRQFWSPKKGSEGQIIHLRRRCQAVSAELVHNAAPGIL